MKEVLRRRVEPAVELVHHQLVHPDLGVTNPVEHFSPCRVRVVVVRMGGAVDLDAWLEEVTRANIYQPTIV